MPLRITILMLAAVATSVAIPALSADSSDSDSVSADVLERYLCVSKNQQSVLRGVQMEVDIDAEVPKLKKSGKLRALRTIPKVGKIVYNTMSYVGDNFIKNDVIARYLQAERDSQESTDMAITPANYKFKYKGLNLRDGREVHIFEVSPRKKRVGLFKGEIWVDRDTALPVHEAGRFVKNPSIFLKKVEFVRDYEIRGGMAFPRRIESVADVRLVGPAKLIINYTNFAKQTGDEVSTTVPAHSGQ